MWVCSDYECREYVAEPIGTTYYGEAIVNCYGETESIDMVRCSDCDNEAIDCMNCQANIFCEEHAVTGNSCEIAMSPFSTDVAWVTQ